MKIEIDDNILIESIVDKVVERLTPLLIKRSMDDNEYFDVKEVAEYLKVKKSFIYGKIHKREIPFIKVGKFPQFLKKDLDLWRVNPYDLKLSKYNLNYPEGRN